MLIHVVSQSRKEQLVEMNRGKWASQATGHYFLRSKKLVVASVSVQKLCGGSIGTIASILVISQQYFHLPVQKTIPTV